MRAGLKDRFIQIQQPTTSSHGETGTPVKTWTQFARIKAGRRAVKGDELLADFGRSAEVDVIYKASWKDVQGVTTQMRIYDEGGEQYFDIRHVPAAGFGRKDAIELYCKATAGAVAP